MGEKSRPRTGSLQFYPRSRASTQTPHFRAFAAPQTGKAKAVNFFGYKAGMIQVAGKDLRKGTASAGHEIVVPATVIECPALQVVGVRVLGQNEERTGTNVLTEVWVEKSPKHLQKRIVNFKQAQSKKKKDRTHASWEDVEKVLDRVTEVRLLVATQPGLTNFGKKRPEVAEVALSGGITEQIAFGKEKLGNELSITDVLENNTLVDVKSVSKGKGMQGVIKRHNVKIQRHKAKKQRAVGSIGPWHPPTVMWTVARPGQMGYSFRTEFNKKILMIGAKGKPITPKSGFPHYGVVQNDFVVLAGSVMGPAKRLVSLRTPVRPFRADRIKFAELSFISTVTSGAAATEDASKAVKMETAKEEKK